MTRRSWVIIDNNNYERIGLKSLLHSSGLPSEVEIHSVSSGLEGLALIYVLRPEIIVIDVTLPRYSGAEIIDFLINRQDFVELSEAMIVIADSKYQQFSHPGLIVIDRRRPDFATKLLKTIRNKANLLPHPEPGSAWRVRLEILTARMLIGIGSRLDHTIEGAYGWNPLKILFTTALFTWGSSIAFLNLAFFPQPELNVAQARLDSLRYRVQYAPSFVLVFLTILAVIVAALTVLILSS